MLCPGLQTHGVPEEYVNCTKTPKAWIINFFPPHGRRLPGICPLSPLVHLKYVGGPDPNLPNVAQQEILMHQV